MSVDKKTNKGRMKVKWEKFDPDTMQFICPECKHCDCSIFFEDSGCVGYSIGCNLFDIDYEKFVVISCDSYESSLAELIG